MRSQSKSKSMLRHTFTECGSALAVIAGWKKCFLNSKLHYFWVPFSFTFVFIHSIFTTHLVISRCLFSEPFFLDPVSSISAVCQSKLFWRHHKSNYQTVMHLFIQMNLPTRRSRWRQHLQLCYVHTLSYNHFIRFIWPCQQCCLPNKIGELQA